MMQVSTVYCPQTGLQCQRTVCLQRQGCVLGNPADVVTQQTGWRCPVCGKGNAPFMPTCGNQMCGVNITGVSSSVASKEETK